MPSYKIDDEEEPAVFNYEKNNGQPKHSCAAVPKCQNLVTSSFNVSFTRANITSPVKENVDYEKDEDVLNDPKLQDEEEDERIESLNDFNGTLKNLDYDITGDVSIQTNLSLISQLDLSACGTPLPIFTEVNSVFRWSLLFLEKFSQHFYIILPGLLMPSIFILAIYGCFIGS